MKKQISYLFLLLSIAGCGRFELKESNTPKDIRIVCISKHLTEMMFALGKGHDLVAVDLTSSYPDSARLLPTVGYHRALNPEGIVSMKPDLVIHSNDIGPAHVIPQLDKLGLKIKTFGAANTYDSAEIVIRQLGDYFGAAKRADSIVAKMESDKLKLRDLRKQFTDTPTVMVIHYGQANNVFFVMSGRKGAADQMIEAAGGMPAIYDARGARQLSAEAIAAANPDIIIATNYGFDKIGGTIASFKSVPGVALTRAAQQNHIFRFEEHDLVYFGPRSADNIIKLMQLFHPGIHVPTH